LKNAKCKNRTQIGSFAAIADQPGVGQIFSFSKSSVFQTGNMIDFTAEKGILFMNQTIFAKTAGMRGDKTAKFIADKVSHERHANGRGPLQGALDVPTGSSDPVPMVLQEKDPWFFNARSIPTL
jgi:hypothetical protein